MKFIREIIGEKRQMETSQSDASIDTIPAETPETDEAATQDIAEPREETLSAEPPVTEADAEGDDAVDAAPETFERADDIDAFLADDTAETDSFEDLSALEAFAEETPEPAASKLFEEDTAEAAPSKLFEEDTIEAAEEDLAKEIDRVLVSDHDPDPSLERVFRAMSATVPNTPDSGASEEAAGDAAAPAPDMHPAPEPIAAQHEAQPAPAPHTAPFATPEPTSAPAEAAAVPVAETPQNVEVPKPAVGRGASRHGRVKTRLLGFNTSMQNDIDPIKDSEEANAAPYTMFAVGWLIVVEGDGRGAAFTLFNGVNNIGRGEDQTVRLNFGDNSISRENHASIAYDPRAQSFFIGHGGKANIVRLNDRPVLSTEEMKGGDQIMIGETTLRFIPLCGPEFSWDASQEAGEIHAARI